MLNLPLLPSEDSWWLVLSGSPLWLIPFPVFQLIYGLTLLLDLFQSQVPSGSTLAAQFGSIPSSGAPTLPSPAFFLKTCSLSQRGLLLLNYIQQSHFPGHWNKIGEVCKRRG